MARVEHESGLPSDGDRPMGGRLLVSPCTVVSSLFSSENGPPFSSSMVAAGRRGNLRSRVHSRPRQVCPVLLALAPGDGLAVRVRLVGGFSMPASRCVGRLRVRCLSSDPVSSIHDRDVVLAFPSSASREASRSEAPYRSRHTPASLRSSSGQPSWPI